MKQLLILVSVLGYLTVTAQKAQVEKSFFGVQAGFLGTWGYNESRIGKQVALRTELGLDATFWKGIDIYEGNQNGFLLGPVLTLEPRYYYNLGKRAVAQKDISKNSGNFISLKTSYHPDWFAISNKDVSIISTVSIIPTWGIRRNIGTSGFNYEAGLGLGYRYIFGKSAGYPENGSDAVLNLHLRIGYTF